METPNTISVCPVGSLSADLYSGNNFRKPADSQTLTAGRPTMPVIKVQPFISGDGAERSWIRKLLAHSVELFICALIIVVVCLAFVFGFGSGSCVGKFQCGFSSQCITSSAQCDGKVDCDNGEDELGCVRLSGRSSVLQVQKEGVWKTVCSEDWNNWLGASACKQLGYNSYVESLFIPLTSIEENLQYDLVSINLNRNLAIKLQNTATFSKPQCTSNNVTTLKCLKCGVRPKYSPRVKHSVQIVGGNLSRPGQFPWQVSLHFNNVHRCGGSIVSAFWIVTAAHCLFGFVNHSMWTVHVGKTMQQADGPQSLAVEKTIFHILYDPKGTDYDIALMKLRKPLVFNASIQTASSRSTFAGERQTQHQQQSNDLKPQPQLQSIKAAPIDIADWLHHLTDTLRTELLSRGSYEDLWSPSACLTMGRILSKVLSAGSLDGGQVRAKCLGFSGDSEMFLHSAMVPILSIKTCNQPEIHQGLISPWMVCAGYLKGGIDACQGDSGGPLACEDSSLWKLVGATSWGIGCAERNKPGVYTRITSFLNWIRIHMEIAHDASEFTAGAERRQGGHETMGGPYMQESPSQNCRWPGEQGTTGPTQAGRPASERTPKTVLPGRPAVDTPGRGQGTGEAGDSQQLATVQHRHMLHGTEEPPPQTGDAQGLDPEGPHRAGEHVTLGGHATGALTCSGVLCTQLPEQHSGNVRVTDYVIMTKGFADINLVTNTAVNETQTSSTELRVEASEQPNSSKVELVSVTEEDLPTIETPNTINVSPLGSLNADSYSENKLSKPAESQTSTACSPTMPVTKVQPFISEDDMDKSWKQKLLARRMELIIAACIILVVCLGLGIGLGVGLSCMGKFQCGFSSQCIRSSAQCDGKVDCDNGEDELGCVRLSGRSSVLQVQREGVWRTVCSEDWNNWLGVSACKQLGYNSYVESFFIPLTSIEQNLQYNLVSISLSHNLSQSQSIQLQNATTFSKTQCTSGRVTTLKCLECGFRPKYTMTRIVGGNISRPGQFPWQVSLHFNSEHLCGGSIVTSFWIVTAAHCLFGFTNQSMWRVHVGQTEQPVHGAQSLAVEKMIFHGRYRPKGLDYDIALMKLSKPLDFDASTFSIRSSVSVICCLMFVSSDLISLSCSFMSFRKSRISSRTWTNPSASASFERGLALAPPSCSFTDLRTAQRKRLQKSSDKTKQREQAGRRRERKKMQPPSPEARQKNDLNENIHHHFGFVEPICLPNYGEEFEQGTECWISGWGATEDEGETSVFLRSAMVPILSTKTCNQPEVYQGLISPWMVCAGYLEGGTDSCQGDSGGPLACEDSSLWKLVGATSWGIGCAVRNKPGVYTRITHSLSWIRQHMEVSP
ncbi:uncharacterized protein tmprss3a [Entelurus aequoreus]|uniref:uncharacterized protein tmprss3a n=1 Tax=Entelurus aequoreus TaxID=161455 RepID=UPI002B1E2C24|nr:uncharacterized protein tmprss3a [Entelurus aequoreus]